jgi:Fe-Mn family superoxide dismutase
MNNNAPSSTTVGFTFTQEPLPYSYEALEPSIDRMTMEIHYLKHHAAYVKNVNEAMAAEGVEANDTNELFKRASLLSAKVRNNAGGAWNHGFFWRSMTPGGKSA